MRAALGPRTRRPGPGRPRRLGAAALLGVAVLTAVGCSADGAAGAASPSTSASVSTAAPAAATAAATPPVISLGAGGLVVVPDAATAWVAAHPTDSRTAKIKTSISGRPTALWLTGNESFGNLTSAVKLAKAKSGTLTLTLWNIPLRYDGLSAPSAVPLAQYQTWVKRVATTLGSTRAVIVLEPDALWFYDRMPTTASQTIRLQALNYAISVLGRYAPKARVYIDAGTSSGSVTPARMATLLTRSAFKHAAGFAVNVSSYAPAGQINTYAQQIRAALQAKGYADPRYVVDTGRNGAASWNFDWCNPTSQRLGAVPGVVSNKTGLDLNLWVKAPGTSDGDCGPAGAGKGSVGGEFLPAVAYKMITG